MKIAKPSVLSDEDIKRALATDALTWNVTGRYLVADIIAKAQRDADVIWFNDWLKQEGYVRLSDDQSLPPTPKDYPTMNLDAYGFKLKEAGWRKVELG